MTSRRQTVILHAAAPGRLHSTGPNEDWGAASTKQKKGCVALTRVDLLLNAVSMQGRKPAYGRSFCNTTPKPPNSRPLGKECGILLTALPSQPSHSLPSSVGHLLLATSQVDPCDLRRPFYIVPHPARVPGEKATTFRKRVDSDPAVPRCILFALPRLQHLKLACPSEYAPKMSPLLLIELSCHEWVMCKTLPMHTVNSHIIRVTDMVPCVAYEGGT